IRIQGVETLVGSDKSCREIQLAADDLDVTRRFSRGSFGQCLVKLTKRNDFGREPALTAQGGGQSVIVPGGQVVVDPVRILLERSLDHVAIIVEDKDDRLESIASHGPD